MPFRDLTSDQRRLLSAFFLFALASPMIITFTNTYLWRQDQDPVTLALFNIGNYLGISGGFLFNAMFLRRFAPSSLFGLGCVFQGIVPLVLVLLGARAAEFAPLLGVFIGIASGFFWGNRNYLTSVTTQGPRRFQFISLEQIGNIASGIVAPAAIGWFIVLGDRYGWYTPQWAYEIAALIGLILLSIAAWRVRPIKTEPMFVRELVRLRPSALWQKLRLMDVTNGVTHGLEAIIPIVIMLTFLGQEDSLGTIQSITAMLAAFMMYVLGRRIKHGDHALILGIWTAVTFLAKAQFAILFSATAALLYFLFNGLVASFRWASAGAVMFEVVDVEQKGATPSERYTLLTDRELFLNAGRVSAIGLFLLSYLTWPEASVRYGLLLTVIFQLIQVQVTSRLTKTIVHEATIHPDPQSDPA